jgi:dTDP-4-amino-4,6-dideoxygalactose transaminase
MSSMLETVAIDPIPATGLVIGIEERVAVQRVLDSGMLAQGPEVAAFEAEFAHHVDGRACVAVSSGTSALLLGLLALGIGPGDEVVVPSFSFAASANAVVLAGAQPVFVDIDPASFCLDPTAVLSAIGPRTSAILAVHLYGHPAPVDLLVEIAARHGLALVEDAAQAHLAALNRRAVGAFGSAGAFSFYPTKNMTSGEGGMVVCADAATARRVRLLRNQGMERRYANEIVGYNARMTDLHAAIGRVQLARLPARTATRRRNASFLSDALAATAHRAELVLPGVAPGAAHAWHQYTVRSSRRDELVAGLRGLGVPAAVYYPTPIHRLPAYDLAVELPETEKAAAQVFSLPVHPALSPAHLDRIVDAVTEAVAQ